MSGKVMAQQSDTAKHLAPSKADTVHPTQKKHKLFSFLKKKVNQTLKQEEKGTVPHVDQPKVISASDTSKKSTNGSSAAVSPLLTPLGNSAHTTPKDTLQKPPTRADSSKSSTHKSFLSKLDNLSSHGSISAGYDYGVLPFASDMQVPMGYFHSEGQGQFKLGVLPFDASYYYSDIKNISGLNNYFRISFDAQKFKQEYADKEAQEVQKLKGTLGQLYKERQMAEQKLLYLKSVENQPDIKTPSVPSVGSPKLPADSSLTSSSAMKKDETVLKKDAASDSLAPSPKSDSLNKDENKLKADTSSSAKSANKSIPNNAPVRDADSAKADISKYEKEIDKCDKEIDKVTKMINSVKHDETAIEHNNPYLAKVYNVMSGFKKLDIGLCYPDYSTFLISGMAIKGINMEYQKHDIYVAASEGTTVNTLLFTNNALQNRLVNMQNLYNMFDFQSVQNGRKVFAVKTGWGEKEGTHLYVGMLYGTGLPSYLNNYNTDPVTGLSKNYVLEIDGKWAITSNSSINLVYGKSSTQTSGDNFNVTDGGLINSQHSKAILGKYELKLRKTKTNLTLTGRWIDPYFNSFGIGYMRADNFRYEIKAEQPFGKKIKVTVFYRKDEDDILELYQYHTVLQTIGINTTIKLMRSLTLRIGYSPVIEHMWGSDPTYNISNNNNISNLVLTYAPTIRNLYTVFNMAYNYYRLTSDTQTVAFQNFSFSNTTRFKNSFSNMVSVNWFKTEPIDSLNNNAWLFTDEVSYNFLRGFAVAIGGKASFDPVTTSWEYGYLAKLKVPLVKHLSCELQAEKLVIGDFYNSFDILQIQKFPYFCQGRLVISW
jgi:hypothetical protein